MTEEKVMQKAMKAYFAYYGKNAPIPSNSSYVGRKYVWFYNCNGLLAKYNIKKETFWPEYE